MRILSILLFIGMITAGCYYDSEENLFPSLPGECDTTEVSYAIEILPLLSSYCIRCHSNADAPSLGNNIQIEDYTDISANADAILGSVSHTSDFSPMPKGGGKISDCSIIKLEAWINQGKLEN